MTFRILISIVIAIWSHSNILALTLSKEEQKEFKKSDIIGLIVDFSKAKVNGLAMNDFVKFYAEEIGKSEDYVRIFLKSLDEYIFTYPSELIPQTLKSQLGKAKNRNYFSHQPQKFNIKVEVLSISTKGAFNANIHFFKDNPDDCYTFFLESKDGKWNDDFQLMKEGMSRLGAMIGSKLDDWSRFGIPKELRNF